MLLLLVLSNYRSSHLRCSVKKAFLTNFAKFTEKHLCQSLFFNKVAGLRPATLFKRRLWHKCFPVNFPKFLRTFLTEHLRWLLLIINPLKNVNKAKYLYQIFMLYEHLSSIPTWEKNKRGQLLMYFSFKTLTSIHSWNSLNY